MFLSNPPAACTSRVGNLHFPSSSCDSHEVSQKPSPKSRMLISGLDRFLFAGVAACPGDDALNRRHPQRVRFPLNLNTTTSFRTQTERADRIMLLRASTW